MKIIIKVVNDGERVVDSHEVKVPENGLKFGYQFYDEHRMMLDKVMLIPLPRPKLVKREGWINPTVIHPDKLSANWVWVSWEEEER